MTNGELISKGYNEFVLEQAELFGLFAIYAVMGVVIFIAVRRIKRSRR